MLVRDKPANGKPRLRISAFQVPMLARIFL
ncbi:hypothetical protein SAMN05880556_102242 [Azospirillum sp. RU38E]|nr:hypothetical protein SAMN05880556_102242 [Azospirillum sp. RU38E]SNS33196.1 hypothetical protein SAMN05880591_102242 [Azospirillum sp. RU37A]